MLATREVLVTMRADARRNRVRILDAARAVFAERGASASTEDVARQAGVAIGTIFRHFPTKNALLQAVVKDLMARLTDEVNAMIAGGDPATALFEFFTRVVEQAAANKAVFDRLAETGVEVHVGAAVQPLHQAIEALLEGAQQAGTVRDDVRAPEVMALLAATSQGALAAGWDRQLQQRTLAIVFAGLRPVTRH
jgi:AcrR family transcriptional regulator